MYAVEAFPHTGNLSFKYNFTAHGVSLSRNSLVLKPNTPFEDPRIHSLPLKDVTCKIFFSLSNDWIDGWTCCKSGKKAKT